MKTIFACLLLLLAGCDKSHEEGCTSGCLDEAVAQFRSSDAICDSGAWVKEYLFQGKTVYVFHQGNCGADYMDLVKDAHCQRIGELGGIAGISKVNGEEFSSAVYQRTVWGN